MDQARYQKLLKRVLILVAIIVVIWIAFTIYQALIFRIVNTDPDVKSVSTVTPFLKVNFNHKLSSNGLTVISSPAVISSHSLSDKTLTLNLNGTLAANTTYTITIVNITDTAGKSIQNKVFTFKPTYVPASQVPQDQQEALLHNQATAPQPPTFTGTDALISNGVTSEQVQDFQQAVTNFATATKQKLSVTAIDSSTVNPTPINPDNPSPNQSITFNVAIAGTTYSAKLIYSGVNSAELVLNDINSGAQIYDSGMLSVQ